jgi:hypothetical protein
VAVTADQDESLTVRGRVVQGTAEGAAIPADLALELLVLDSAGNLAAQYDGVTGAEGAYEFTQVARAAGDVYLIRVVTRAYPGRADQRD